MPDEEAELIATAAIYKQRDRSFQVDGYGSTYAHLPLKRPDVHVEVKILGFQSPKDLSVDYNLKHSYFLYPNETVI